MSLLLLNSSLVILLLLKYTWHNWDWQGKPLHSVHLPMSCCMPGLCQQTLLSRMHSFQSTSPDAFLAPKLLSLINNYPLLSSASVLGCWSINHCSLLTKSLLTCKPHWNYCKCPTNKRAQNLNEKKLNKRGKNPQRNKQMKKVLQKKQPL